MSRAGLIVVRRRNIRPQRFWQYPPTHFVAPYTMVPGATSDQEDLGDAAYSAAQSQGLWTTAGTAAARARQDHKVMWRRGEYTCVVPDTDFTPGFRIIGDSGASATHPVVHFAEYPAAYHYGDDSLYTKIMKSVTTPPTTPGVMQNAALGTATGAHHTILDGFYADEDTCPAGPNTGMFQFRNAVVGCKYRRIAIDRGNNYTSAGFNANAVYFQGVTDPVLEDSLFMGRTTYSSNKRQTGNCEVYNTANYTIRHTTNDGNYTGHYIKENDGGPAILTYGRMHNILCRNVTHGLGVQQGDNEVDHSIVILDEGAEASLPLFMVSADERPDKTWLLHHLTLIAGANASGIVGLSGPGTDTLFVDCEMVDSILVAKTGFTGFLASTGGGSIPTWAWADWLWDRNRYWSQGGTYQWKNPVDNTTKTGLAAWQAVAGEANSSTGDPQFVDMDGEDLRLQGGSPAAGKGAYETGNEEIGMRSIATCTY